MSGMVTWLILYFFWYNEFDLLIGKYPSGIFPAHPDKSIKTKGIGLIKMVGFILQKIILTNIK